MKLIPLTQGKSAMVDNEDYDRLIIHKWCLQKHKNSDIEYGRSSLFISCKNTVVLLLHREVMNLDDDSKLVVDHIDKNGLNNQKSNLRICTRSENLKNKRSKKNSSSKYLGVIYRKNTGKYDSVISIDKKNKHLGSFINELDAAKSYNEAAKIHHGEFANLNQL